MTSVVQMPELCAFSLLDSRWNVFSSADPSAPSGLRDHLRGEFSKEGSGLLVALRNLSSLQSSLPCRRLFLLAFFCALCPQGANGASMLAVGGRYNLDKQSVISCERQLKAEQCSFRHVQSTGMLALPALMQHSFRFGSPASYIAAGQLSQQPDFKSPAGLTKLTHSCKVQYSRKVRADQQTSYTLASHPRGRPHNETEWQPPEVVTFSECFFRSLIDCQWLPSANTAIQTRSQH